MRRLLAVTVLLLGFSDPLLAQICPPNLPPPVAPDSRYAISEPLAGQRVVTDLETGLQWKQCPEGLDGPGCTSGSLSAMNWQAALAAANASSHGGFTDWRLPSAVELHSLVETSCHSPAINSRVFPGNGTGLYWTSSTYDPAAFIAASAWVVNFVGGNLVSNGKILSLPLRLVRGGQRLDPFDASGDFSPDAFSFPAQASVPLSDLRTSASITVSGIDTVVGIGVSGAADSAYAINGGPFVSSPGAVSNGDSVAVRHTSAAVPLASVTTTLQIGALTADFVATTTSTHTIGGTVSGLEGSGLVLQNNGGDDLPIAVDGSFTFNTALEDGSGYTVTVLTQPGSPSQTCSVTDDSGTLAGANVTTVQVTCATNSYTVGGTVTGLSGTGLVLQNNGGDDLPVAADGSFTFATALLDESAYAVTVLSQPNAPSQTCTVMDDNGTLAGANVTTVQVTCATNTYTVGGTVSGLFGTGLVLQNNAGDDLPVAADGSFTFATALLDESTYAVTVLTQPGSPSQTCTVTEDSGTLAGANVTSVQVTCATNSYTVGGTVSGLSGTGLVLQNNGGDDLPVAADGSFAFATALLDESAYAVTVLTQPTNPSQTCVIDNAEGTLAGADVTDVLVGCTIDSYTVKTTRIGNGNISPGTQSVEHGDTASFTVTPQADHHVLSVLGDSCTPVDQGDGHWEAANITEDCVVTASFAANPLLQVSFSGAGTGQVLSMPPGIDCPGSCAAVFPPGTSVTLTATLGASAYRALGWAGVAGCAGAGSCTFALEEDLEVAAGFGLEAGGSLRFFGNGSTAPGLDRVAVSMEPDGSPVNIGAGDFTLELWLKSATGNDSPAECIDVNEAWIDGNILLDRDTFGDGDHGDFGLSMMSGRLAFGISRGSEGTTVCGSTDLRDGHWHHVAITRDVNSGQVQLWLDGVLDAQGSGPVGDVSYRVGRPTPWPWDSFLILGAEKHDVGEHDVGQDYPSWSGWLDELRLSVGQRYATSFTPDQQLLPDADTVALYRFDEGEGSIVFDESGQSGGPSHGDRRLGGSPAGPCWSEDVPSLGRIFAADFEPVGCASP